MSISYNRSLSNDFSGNLNPSQLKDEINAGTIVPICLVVINISDVVTIKFNSALSNNEVIEMDQIIAEHVVIQSGSKTVKNITITSSTLSTYQTRDTLTTSYLPIGTYKIDWFYTFTVDDGSPDIKITVDDSIIIHENISQVPIASNTIDYDKNGFNVINLNEGVHIIKLQYKGEKSGLLTISKSILYISEA